MARTKQNGTAAAEPTLKELMAEFGTVKNELKETKERADKFQNLAMTLLANKPPAAAEQPLEQPNEPGDFLDLAGLPDPAQDYEAYTKALQARISTAIRTGVTTTVSAAQAEQARQNASAQARNAKFDRLWGKFRELHPNLAKHEDFVELIARQNVAEMAARGIDPEVGIFADEDGFIKDVVERTNKRFTEMGIDPAKVGKSPNEGKTSNENKGLQGGFAPIGADVDTDEDLEGEEPEVGATPATRTGGLIGGQQGAGIEGLMRQDRKKPGNMYTELTDIQRKSGFF